MMVILLGKLPAFHPNPCHMARKASCGGGGGGGGGGRTGSRAEVSAGVELRGNRAAGIGPRCLGAPCGGGGGAIYDTSTLRLLAGSRLFNNRQPASPQPSTFYFHTLAEFSCFTTYTQSQSPRLHTH